MKPLLVLEGPDGGGKTTIAETLECEHGYRRLHMGPPGAQSPYDQYLTALADVVHRQRTKIDERPVVFDRLHLGERVYGSLIRENDRLGPLLNRQLDRVLLGLGAVMVHVATDTETMVRTWSHRLAQGKEYVATEGAMRNIIARYQTLFKEQELRCMTWDYQRHPEGLHDLMKGADMIAPTNLGPGIGFWKPQHVTLLVGERINSEFRGSIDWPFTGPGGSSLWFTEKLQEWGVRERQLYWVNAKTPLGDDLDPKFIELLQPKKIVALGNTASTWCETSLDAMGGGTFYKVEHPQAWKRFHYKEAYPLRKVLCE